MHFWVSYHKRRSCQRAEEITQYDGTCTDLQRAIILTTGNKIQGSCHWDNKLLNKYVMIRFNKVDSDFLSIDDWRDRGSAMLPTTALRNAEVHCVSNLEITLESEKTKHIYHSCRNRVGKFRLQSMRDQKPSTGHRIVCLFAKKNHAFLLSDFLPIITPYVSNINSCLAFFFFNLPSFSS